MLGETQNPFSLTRVALGKCRRGKGTKFLLSVLYLMLAVLVPQFLTAQESKLVSIQADGTSVWNTPTNVYCGLLYAPSLKGFWLPALSDFWNCRATNTTTTIQLPIDVTASHQSFFRLVCCTNKLSTSGELIPEHPVYWFSPLAPIPMTDYRPFIGSTDFISLFTPDAAWPVAASHIQVFKLGGEWVTDADDGELRQAVADFQRRGMAISLEAGPLNPTAECGQGVEGFPGIAAGLQIVSRVKAAGGDIRLLAMDEPFFYGHFYGGSNACHWSAERIAAEVNTFIQAIRQVVPGIIVGDIEPLAGAAGVADYEAWLDTFRRVNGYDLAFLHLDLDWSRVTWPEDVEALVAYGSEHGIPVGLIYDGNSYDPTDEAWLSAAGERVKKYELDVGGTLHHVVFQSWQDHPDFVLPEANPFTFTGFIRLYFEDKSALGFRLEGQGADLAYNKPVSASAWVAGSEPELAVDRDTATRWISGAFAPQWIQIDLGKPYDVMEISLIPAQYPDGSTFHRVLGKGSSPTNTLTLLHLFQGYTKDGEAISYTPPQPWQAIRFVRIETISSPSWVAWREIQIIDAGK